MKSNEPRINDFGRSTQNYRHALYEALSGISGSDPAQGGSLPIGGTKYLLEGNRNKLKKRFEEMIGENDEEFDSELAEHFYRGGNNYFGPEDEEGNPDNKWKSKRDHYKFLDNDDSVKELLDILYNEVEEEDGGSGLDSIINDVLKNHDD